MELKAREKDNQNVNCFILSTGIIGLDTAHNIYRRQCVGALQTYVCSIGRLAGMVAGIKKETRRADEERRQKEALQHKLAEAEDMIAALKMSVLRGNVVRELKGVAGLVEAGGEQPRALSAVLTGLSSIFEATGVMQAEAESGQRVGMTMPDGSIPSMELH